MLHFATIAIILSCTLLFTILLSYTFNVLYVNRNESTWITSFITTTSLSLALLALLLIPSDVWVVSTDLHSNGSHHNIELIENIEFILRIIYIITYGIMLLYVFVLIPFTYFYYEEKDMETRTKHRVLHLL